MQSTDIPVRFPIPFGASAGAGYLRAIPKDHQAPTTTDAPASLHDGFPPETFTPEASGGIPPSGADFNGILYQLSAWARWQAAGSPTLYNADFATAIGGYMKYTMLCSTTVGRVWQSSVENNLTDPDSLSAAGWTLVASPNSGSDNYTILPDGKVEQWGYVALSSVDEPAVPVTLIVPYANASYSITVSPSIDSPSVFKDTWTQVIRSSKTSTAFLIQYQHPGGATQPGLDGFEWRCIGRPA